MHTFIIICIYSYEVYTCLYIDRSIFSVQFRPKSRYESSFEIKHMSPSNILQRLTSSLPLDWSMLKQFYPIT